MSYPTKHAVENTEFPIDAFVMERRKVQKPDEAGNPVEVSELVQVFIKPTTIKQVLAAIAADFVNDGTREGFEDREDWSWASNETYAKTCGKSLNTVKRVLLWSYQAGFFLQRNVRTNNPYTTTEGQKGSYPTEYLWKPVIKDEKGRAIFDWGANPHGLGQTHMGLGADPLWATPNPPWVTPLTHHGSGANPPWVTIPVIKSSQNSPVNNISERAIASSQSAAGGSLSEYTTLPNFTGLTIQTKPEFELCKLCGARIEEDWEGECVSGYWEHFNSDVHAEAPDKKAVQTIKAVLADGVSRFIKLPDPYNLTLVAIEDPEGKIKLPLPKQPWSLMILEPRNIARRADRYDYRKCDSVGREYYLQSWDSWYKYNPADSMFGSDFDRPNREMVILPEGHEENPNLKPRYSEKDDTPYLLWEGRQSDLWAHQDRGPLPTFESVPFKPVKSAKKPKPVKSGKSEPPGPVDDIEVNWVPNDKPAPEPPSPRPA